MGCTQCLEMLRNAEKCREILHMIQTNNLNLLNHSSESIFSWAELVYWLWSIFNFNKNQAATINFITVYIFLTVSWQYLGNILAISSQYPSNILTISCQYLDNILAIFWQYLGNIFSFSWHYQGNIMAISRQYLENIFAINR